MDSDFVIDVQGMTKRFGAHGRERIRCQVRRGEMYRFLGPNGSGKTTFLRMMCGLLTPDGGSGLCLGFDIPAIPEIKRNIGYMTQRFSFYEDLTIVENLDFVARIYGLPGRPPMEKSLDNLGMTNGGTSWPANFPAAGTTPALSACLLHPPQLLLLDEPTAGVDPKARRDFWDEFTNWLPAA